MKDRLEISSPTVSWSFNNYELQSMSSSSLKRLATGYQPLKTHLETGKELIYGWPRTVKQPFKNRWKTGLEKFWNQPTSTHQPSKYCPEADLELAMLNELQTAIRFA